RVRLERLAEKMERVGEDGRLAHLRLAEAPVHPKKVAQVELLRQRPTGFADLLLPEHDLDAAGPVLEVQEMDLALSAALDNPPGGADAGPLVLRQVGGQAADGRDRLMPVEPAAPRVEAELLDAAQLVGTADFENVLRFGHGGDSLLVESKK